MEDLTEENREAYPTLVVSAGRKLLRFVLAGVTALLIVFITLLFMRFLVKGYDDKATTKLSRYISLPSITIHRRSTEEFKPIKPLLEPDFELDEDNDFTEQPMDEEMELKIEAPDSVPGRIEAEIVLPGLANTEVDDRDKMRQIKEALTSDGSE